MALTRDQAQEQLRQAIVNHAEAFSLVDPGFLLNDIACMAAWIDPENDQVTHYATVSLRQGRVPNYILGGIFMEGVTACYNGTIGEGPED